LTTRKHTYPFIPEEIESTFHPIGVIAFFQRLEKSGENVPGRTNKRLHNVSVSKWARSEGTIFTVVTVQTTP